MQGMFSNVLVILLSLPELLTVYYRIFFSDEYYQALLTSQGVLRICFSHCSKSAGKLCNFTPIKTQIEYFIWIDRYTFNIYERFNLDQKI